MPSDHLDSLLDAAGAPSPTLRPRPTPEPEPMWLWEKRYREEYSAEFTEPAYCLVRALGHAFRDIALAADLGSIQQK